MNNTSAHGRHLFRSLVLCLLLLIHSLFDRFQHAAVQQLRSVSSILLSSLDKASEAAQRPKSTTTPAAALKASASQRTTAFSFKCRETGHLQTTNSRHLPVLSRSLLFFFSFSFSLRCNLLILFSSPHTGLATRKHRVR